MKTILLFPGIDAIETDQIRKTCIRLPEVQRRIKEAQAILDKLQVPIRLEKVMHSKREESLEWFSTMVLAAMPVQVGVFDRYRNHGHPIDALLGMSLGDLARSVCAGVSTFSAAFIGLLKFVQAIPSALGTGSTYQVKLKKPKKKLLKYLKCKDYGLEVSVYQSDVSLLISGPVAQLKVWSKCINKLEDVTAKELFKIPIPLHSKLLKNAANAMAPYIYKSANFERAKYPIYSTVFNMWIKSSAELKMDMVKNIYASVRYKQSIHQLVAQEGPIRFVNIGPASTMLAFIKQMKLSKDRYEVVNYFSEASNYLTQTASA